MHEVKELVNDDDAQASQDLADELGYMLSDRHLKNVIVENALAMLIDQQLTHTGRIGLTVNYTDGSSIEFIIHPAPEEKQDENTSTETGSRDGSKGS